MKGNGASAMTASAMIPTTDISGLGTAATQNIGTSGPAIPQLNGANSWSANQTLSVTGGTTQFILASDAGQYAVARYQTGGSTRWFAGKDNSGEGGANAGSDYVVTRFSDAGSNLGSALSINRATGNVTVGALIATTSLTLDSGAGVASFSLAPTGAGYIQSVAHASAFAEMIIRRSRGTLSSPTVVATNDVLGGLRTQYYDGSTFRSAGTIRSVMLETTPGPAAGGSAMDIQVSPIGSITSATAFRFSSAANITYATLTPNTDNILSLGGAANRWSVVYAGSGTINTSDARDKRDVQDISDALLDAWGDVAWRSFRFNDAYDRKGEGARWHFGAMAQQVREAIDASMGEGAALRLGLLCHDQWDAVPEEVDGEGGTIVAARPAGDRWGLRYEECFVVEAAWQRRRLARIEARIDALVAGGGGDAAG